MTNFERQMTGRGLNDAASKAGEITRTQSMLSKFRGWRRRGVQPDIALDLAHTSSDPGALEPSNTGEEVVIGENFGFPSSKPNRERRNGLDNGKKWLERQKATQEYEFRDIKEGDVDTMIKDEWFKDPERATHLWGDTVNEQTYPRDWNDQTQVSKFKQALQDFYFPGDSFIIHAKNGDGEKIRDARVRRKTRVVEKDGVLAGATSWLEGVDIDELGRLTPNLQGDPWANNVESRMKQSHTQMHVVSPEYEKLGIGIGLLVDRSEEIFRAGYSRIITWVNHVPGYERIETLFESIGYEEARGKKDKIYINPTVPGGARIEMTRFILERGVWEKGGIKTVGFNQTVEIGREAAIQRWEDRIQGIGIRRRN